MRSLTASFVGWCVAFSGAFLVAGEISATHTDKQKDKPKVTLKLVSAVAEHVDGSDCILVCRVMAENKTGAPLRIKSRFNSVFDGFDVVIMDRKGKQLSQQSYIFHQSPRLKEREFILPVGKTKSRLAFDLRDLPKAPEQLQVRLVGTLLGSGYEPAVITKAVRVKVKKTRK